MAPNEGLSAAEAGALVKQRRKERGLTQEQLVEKTGLSSQSYLSALEKGRYHIGRSEHFGAVAQALSLSAEDVKAINPSAVITLAAPPRKGPPVPPVVPFRDTPVTIPRELQEMIDKHSGQYPMLLDPTIQRIIAAPRNFGGPDAGPQTAEDWFEYWMVTKRYIL